MEWYYIAGFFAAMVIIKFSINFYKYKKTLILMDVYIENIGDNHLKIASHKSEIISLFKDAGIKDQTRPHLEPMGFGQLAQSSISVYTNLATNRADIAEIVMRFFNEASGVYKRRYLESFNPIFWIDFVLKLPQYLMGYFGVAPEKIGVKIFNVMYWIASVLFTLFKTGAFDEWIKR